LDRASVSGHAPACHGERLTEELRLKHGAMNIAVDFVCETRDEEFRLCSRISGVRVNRRPEEAAPVGEATTQQLLIRAGGGRRVFSLPRTASPYSCLRNRDLALGDAQRNSLQIVLARAADLNVFLGHEFAPQGPSRGARARDSLAYFFFAAR
jgi:hypothetical protein